MLLFNTTTAKGAHDLKSEVHQRLRGRSGLTAFTAVRQRLSSAFGIGV